MSGVTPGLPKSLSINVSSEVSQPGQPSQSGNGRTISYDEKPQDYIKYLKQTLGILILCCKKYPFFHWIATAQPLSTQYWIFLSKSSNSLSSPSQGQKWYNKTCTSVIQWGDQSNFYDTLTINSSPLSHPVLWRRQVFTAKWRTWPPPSETLWVQL